MVSGSFYTQAGMRNVIIAAVGASAYSKIVKKAIFVAVLRVRNLVTNH